MDQDVIVEQVIHRCKRLIDKILHAQDLQSVAAISLAIFAHMRDIARAILQATIDPTTPFD